MVNSNNTSNTYDKSTLDAKFKAITDKLLELKQSLSSCVTKEQNDKNISNSINNALGELPKHYVTYEELLVYLKDYITSDNLKTALNVNPDTVTMLDRGLIGLMFENDMLSLRTEPPYVAPTASISVSPYVIEYGSLDSTVVLTVSVSDANKIKSLFISGGNLSNEEVTSSRRATDLASNTQPTRYMLTYINDKDQSSQDSCSTVIGKRVLYGVVQPNATTFSSVEKLKSYPGTSLLTTSNPSSISITQGTNQYGWVATPWKIKSFTDTSINFPGGWVSKVSDGQLDYTEYDSPYGDGKKYYVYRTTNPNLGTINWKITNN